MRLLKPHLTPSRLVEPGAREGVEVVTPVRPSRFRTLQVARSFVAFVLGVAWMRLTRTYTREEFARRLRQRLEDLGGLWIKAGQLMSLRIDVFSAEVCRELTKLQTRSFGFPTEIARATVETALGAPIDRFFDEFEDTPFAAASVGQIHRGRLRDEGVWVAVKVQKPFTAEMFKADLTFIRWLALVLDAISFYPSMRWKEGLWELQQIMREEIDFRFEASAMRRMRKSLKRHKIYVPKVFARYSSDRVLVMEFVHGILMADYIRLHQTDPVRASRWCDENNVEPKVVARRLIHSMFRQLFEDNLYHGDLHPGNIVLLRDSRTALIDFGTTAFTEKDYLQRFLLFVRALATRDYAKAADLCFLLCAVLPAIDLEPVKERVIRALRGWAMRTLVKELPYHDKSLDNATVEVTKLLLDEGCTMEWAFLRIRRAITTLDASLIHLYPDVNYTKTLQDYFEKSERRALLRIMGPEALRRAIGSVATGLEIQERVNEYTMFQGSLIRRHAAVFQGATNKFANFLGAVVAQVGMLVGITAALLLAIFVQQHYPRLLPDRLARHLEPIADGFPHLGLAMWGLVFVVNGWLYVSAQRIRKRLEMKDVRGQHESVAPL
jgi:ubiquinone biosynthesis protein